MPTAHQKATKDLPLVVVLHGTNRTAARYRTMFIEFAEEHGRIVLAPLFPAGIIDPEDLNNYKRIRYHDIRFDHVLLDMVEQIGACYRVEIERFLLHGFSGGGQFVHRFAHLHPTGCPPCPSARPAGSPGSTPTCRGGVGTDLAEIFGTELDLPTPRRVPIQMIVGAEDTETWEIAEPGIDAGGDTRVERLRTLRDNWETHGIPVQLDVIPGMGHIGSRGVPHTQRFFSELLRSRAERRATPSRRCSAR